MVGFIMFYHVLSISIFVLASCLLSVGCCLLSVICWLFVVCWFVSLLVCWLAGWFVLIFFGNWSHVSAGVSLKVSVFATVPPSGTDWRRLLPALTTGAPYALEPWDQPKANKWVNKNGEK